jgi:mRNA interferase MazF
MSIPFQETDRTLLIVVPHTTTVAGSRFEISIAHSTLQPGAFDVQQITAIPAAKFIRRLGVFSPHQIKIIEERLATLLAAC